MRTSLIEIEKIENFLEKKGEQEERLLLEAKIQVNSELARRVVFQKLTYRIIQEYGRKRFRHEIGQIDREVFENPDYLKFQRNIQSIFR